MIVGYIGEATPFTPQQLKTLTGFFTDKVGTLHFRGLTSTDLMVGKIAKDAGWKLKAHPHTKHDIVWRNIMSQSTELVAAPAAFNSTPGRLVWAFIKRAVVLNMKISVVYPSGIVGNGKPQGRAWTQGCYKKVDDKEYAFCISRRYY